MYVVLSTKNPKKLQQKKTSSITPNPSTQQFIPSSQSNLSKKVKIDIFKNFLPNEFRNFGTIKPFEPNLLIIKLTLSNKKMNILLISAIILFSQCQAITDDPCQPLWPRLEFGNIFSDFGSSEKLVIKFNTRSSCPNSHVLINDQVGTIRKVYCEPSTIETSDKMNSYKAFVQRCSISQISFQQNVTYLAYGSNSTSGVSIPFSSEPTQISIIHPNSTKSLKLIVLADWSQIHEKLAQFKSINESLDLIRMKQNPHGLLINGDIAYDLDSNNGTNYEEFLNMLSRVARFLPVFVNTGNHQHNSEDALKLFYGTFELYGKDKKLANGISLGHIFLVGFDPYQTVYKKSNLIQNLRQTDPASLQGLAQALLNGTKTQKIIIPSSHYPLKCSANNKNCQNDTKILKDYWELMFENNVKFYIGAHYHTYERVYPYCQNKTFSLIKSPYNLKDEKCIVSIIEGIAGNEQKIIDSYEDVKDYTAALSFGKTGLGLLTAEENSLNYKHFSSNNILTLQDQFDIIFEKKGEFKLLEE